MALKIVILPPAKLDIQVAVAWYDKQETGLGKKFKLQLIRTIDSLLDPIKGYGLVYMNLSRVFTDVFPYVVYFKLDSTGQRLVIYAILHQKQDKDEILRKRV